MAESKKDPQNTTEGPKQPFVSEQDRPEVRLTPDTPLSELRIRHLREIIDQFGPFHKLNNTLLELLLHDTVTLKSRFTKEKPEIIEIDIPKHIEWPPRIPGPDPRLDLVIQAVSGLTNQVNQLANQVAELQKRLQH